MQKNDMVKQFLNVMKSGNAVHGYLLTCGNLKRAEQTAKEGAAILMQVSPSDTAALKMMPDYYEFDGSIKIDDLRAIRLELYKQAYSGKSRVIVITNAHMMNDNAINAMLKMLEEPPENTYFLLTGYEHRILPTVRSRCHIVRLGAEGREYIISELRSSGATQQEAIKYADISDGNTERAIRLCKDESYRELRENAIKALLKVMNGKIDFSWAKGINKNRDAAVESIEFMLSVCSDADAILSGGKVRTNTDKADEIKKGIKGFTISQIGFIIKVLTDTSMRLATNSSVTMTLDGMLVRIAEQRMLKAKS